MGKDQMVGAFVYFVHMSRLTNTLMSNVMFFVYSATDQPFSPEFLKKTTINMSVF